MVTGVVVCDGERVLRVGLGGRRGFVAVLFAVGARRARFRGRVV